MVLDGRFFSIVSSVFDNILIRKRYFSTTLNILDNTDYIWYCIFLFNFICLSGDFARECFCYNSFLAREIPPAGF